MTHLRNITRGGVFSKALEGKDLPDLEKFIQGSFPYTLYQSLSLELLLLDLCTQDKNGKVSSNSIILTDF